MLQDFLVIFISWRASFLVYLISLISIVLCLIFLPNDKIGGKSQEKGQGVFKEYSVFIGFANGLGIPFIISIASQKAGKTAATTVMPLISMAMYLAQFVTPMILSVVSALVGADVLTHLPYAVACENG